MDRRNLEFAGLEGSYKVLQRDVTSLVDRLQRRFGIHDTETPKIHRTRAHINITPSTLSCSQTKRSLISTNLKTPIVPDVIEVEDDDTPSRWYKPPCKSPYAYSRGSSPMTIIFNDDNRWYASYHTILFYLHIPVTRCTHILTFCFV